MTDPASELPDTWEEAEAQAEEQRAREVSAAGQQANSDDAGDNTASDEATLPDLSFLEGTDQQKRLAELLGDMDPEKASAFAEFVQTGFMPNKHFTNLRKKDKARLRKIEDLARDGEQWRTLKNDEGAMREWLQLMNQRLGTTEEPEVPEDLFLREPKEALGTLEQRFERLIDQRLSQLEQKLEASQRAPKEHEQSLRMAVADWYEEQGNGLSEADVTKATQHMARDIGMDDLTPALVTRLLPRYVDLVQREAAAEAAEKANKSKRDTLKKAGAASPRGGVGAGAPGGKTFQDRLKALREKLGREPRIDERSDLAYDMIAETRGASEEEAEQALGQPKRRR